MCCNICFSLLTDAAAAPWYEDPYACFSVADITNHTADTIQMVRLIVSCVVLNSLEPGSQNTFVWNFASCLRENGVDPDSDEVMDTLMFHPTANCWDMDAIQEGQFQLINGYTVCVSLWRESEVDVQTGPDQVLVCPVQTNVTLHTDEKEVGSLID